MSFRACSNIFSFFSVMDGITHKIPPEYSLFHAQAIMTAIKALFGVDNGTIFHYNVFANGVWRSLVSRLVRVQEASGSNPDTPTKKESPPIGWTFLFIKGSAYLQV